VIDHLVYATPDLAATMAEVERAIGVAPVIGGRHIGRGTWNALISLAPEPSDTSGPYLELIAPDPEQDPPDDGRPFGVDSVTAPRLVAWAARTTNIDETLAIACARGFDPGPAVSMQRATPSGDMLAWRLTAPMLAEYAGLVPFIIDWGDMSHPSVRSPRGAHLAHFAAEHPDDAPIKSALAAVGVTNDLHVKVGPIPALRAVIVGPTGQMTLH
jgi:hypothetical protein